MKYLVMLITVLSMTQGSLFAAPILDGPSNIEKSAGHDRNRFWDAFGVSQYEECRITMQGNGWNTLEMAALVSRARGEGKDNLANIATAEKE